MNATIRGRRALVTGASSGIGADIGRELGARGCNLVLVARRQDLLNTLRDELTARFGIEADVITADLTELGAVERIHEQLNRDGKPVDILVNNAGFGLHGQFVDIPWHRERNMLELDILVLTELTKVFARDMLTRNYGFIMQLSSIGAFQPSPTYASYAAAKTYVLNFGIAVNYEFRNTGVSCTVVAPGIVATEFLQVAGQKPSRYQRLMMMSSEQTARIAVEAMLERRTTVVPGRRNALNAFATRLVPRQVAAAFAYRSMTRY